MDEQRQNAYITLIHLLLSCSNSDEELELLKINTDLLDTGLIEVMEQTAAIMVAEGKLEGANYLKTVAAKLAASLASLSSSVLPKDEQRLNAYMNLINLVLRCPTGEEQKILNSHSDLIDSGLVEMILQVAMIMGKQGNQRAAQFLKSTAVKVEQRIKAYLKLIELLLNCPQGQELTLLNNNSHLLDAGWVQMLEKVGTQLAKQGDRNAAEFLIHVARQRRFTLGISSNITHNITDSEYRFFLLHLLQITQDTRGNRQAVYELLSANLDKLDSNLARVLRGLVTAKLSEAKPDEARSIAAVTAEFSTLIAQFPLGIPAYNVEIAVTGLEISATVFTRTDCPDEWAVTQMNLGNAYLYRLTDDKADNLERAIVAYKAAIEVYTLKAFPEQWATIKNNLGNAYCQRIYGNKAENIDKAIAAYEEAIKFYDIERFPERSAGIHLNLGNAYQYRIKGNQEENFDKAIVAYQAALQVYTLQAFPEQWATIHNNLGNIYCKCIRGNRADNLDKAITAYEVAMQVRTRKAFPEKWADTQNNLGLAHFYKGQIDKASQCYLLVLKVLTPTAFPDQCLQAARNLGSIAFASGRWPEAKEGYRVAIEAVEQKRIWASTDLGRQVILSETISLYRNMVQACINNNQPDTAIEYVERSKARNLVELLVNRDIYPKGNIPETVVNELKRLRREVVAEQRRLDITEQNRSGGIISGTGEPMLDSAALLKNRDRLNQLLQQLDNLITTEIDPIDPNFRATQQVKPISSNEIQNLVDDRTTIVEWYITDENFHTFIITHQSQHPKVWSSSTEERQAFWDWQDEYLQDYQQNREQWIEKLLERLYRLSEILHIDDIINNLPSNCNQIILIPHRFLHLIPLHALPLSKGGCLLDRFPRGVRYAPSCQLLQLTQNQERTNFDRLLAIQNPTQDLGYTSVEVGIIQHYFSRADIFVEDAAKKAALVEVKIKDNDTREVVQNSQLSLANCIHFSCHGEFNFESPLDSALLLAEGERLTLGEIFDLDLSQCRLVTLSACETGLTNYKILSDEYVGIPSSFLYAGSPSVVSSLWTVQNVSTAFLMIKFYQNISACKKVAIALNQAQVWLRNLTKKELKEWLSENKISLDATLNMSLRRRLHKMPDNEQPFKSPFHWAAFCAIGQ
ncbi:CHAT domain-containing protein [Planktothrix paucivesiculata]|uniref:Tetratricopeptide repeat domain protein n=1 Tax=Planktothrix paucivesiculata PCC 9631 TaxID=671071 RepID=A0A7Z9DYX9_9CYAN|nr:CHAT domain-containing protein [Planktothrix paucivesiculata]VXD16712.1 Tetratricopeptide repeat domain protein [Planktothrix paucivesiculata PCC 9631]